MPRAERPDTTRSHAVDFLLSVVDAGFAGVVFIAPLIMGGRHPVGRLIFVLATVVVSTAWFGRQCLLKRGYWKHSSAQLLLLAGLLLIVLQIVELPGQLAVWLSPHVAETLPLWRGDAHAPGQFGTWSRVSLAPELTRGGLAMYLSYGLLFLIAVQRIESVRDVERFLRWIAVAALCMATFGIVQYFMGNGKFLWVYDHPFRDTSDFVKGSFMNRNHFAHFLALGIGPMAWWAVDSERRKSAKDASAFGSGRSQVGVTRIALVVSLVGLAIVLFAGLSSLSRGGAVAMLVSVIVVGVVFLLASVLSAKLIAGLLGVGLLLTASLFIYGYDQVLTRLDDFTTGSLDELDHGRGRRMIWAANVAAFRDHWLIGTGVGSHREVYPKYLDRCLPVEYTHAESGYLQVASETGIAGLLLLASGIGMCVYWCVQSVRHSDSKHVLVCVGAVAAGLAASVVHSIYDFVWYIPACMSMTVLLAACAQRLWHFSNDKTKQSSPATVLSQGAWVAVLAVTLVVGAWMTQNRLGPALASSDWDSYLRDSSASLELELSGDEFLDELFTAPATPKSTALTDSMIDRLTKVLAVHPGHSRAHMRMARLCLRRFEKLQLASENAMMLSQIRDAAIASQFTSRGELEKWLDRAVGPSRKLLDKALWHVRRGLSLCPMQGDGYIFLTELCFLEGGGSPAKSAYMNQALAVRPYDESVLYEAGREAMLAGELQKAVAYWRQSFHNGTVYRHHLVRLLAGRVPVEFILQNIQPKLSDWALMKKYYEAIHQPLEQRKLYEYYLALADSEVHTMEGAEATRVWLMMYRWYRQLGQPEKALASCRQAFEITPNDFEVRYALGFMLLDEGSYSEAEKHLRWCLARKPSSGGLKDLMKRAVKERIKNADRNMPATMR